MQPTILVQSKFQAGWALHQQGRLDEAARAYSDVLGLYPRHFPALHLLGVIAREQGRPEEAADLIRRALKLNPNVAAAWANLGNALQDSGRVKEALAQFDKATAMEPAQPAFHLNRGNALSEMFRFAPALGAYDEALRLNPRLAEAHCYRGMALHALARFDEAVAAYDRAVALQPAFGEAHFNKGMTQLLRGEWKAGWENYEWRKRSARRVADRTYPRPLLTTLAGVEGKTVLVHWEQGLGDSIQFARFLPLLVAKGARVLFAPQPLVRSLLAGLDGVTLVDADRPPDDFDFYVPLLSLARLLDVDETGMSGTPYLAAERARMADWRARIGDRGFRIGICWQGNPSFKPDGIRSVPLHYFGALSGIPGVRLISVHKGSGEAQLQSLPPDMQVETLPDLAVGPDGFLDTAAVLASLDLVISSDTVVPHLSGALGVPTWVALQHVPDWRWLWGRSDLPWYPGMRLFRQRSAGDWDGVFADIRTALLERLGRN